ncbi:MAG: hypothetical protein ACLFM7_12010 [Bacteroidales bacterium]
MKTFKWIVWVIVIHSVCTNELSGENIKASFDTLTFTVKTYDGLELPARVMNRESHDKKMILFINGSTPYDEKGNIGAFWTDEGKIFKEKHNFYHRFIDIMSSKGYPIATMAKRSFICPTKIPRPNFSDLALDIKCYIGELKRRGLLKDEKDLVIVGYSEGSIVASKVLGILKSKPHACILLGSADLTCNCNNPEIENFYMTDVLRRLKDWTDKQIKAEFSQLCQLQEDLSNMDEEQFENEYKHSNPFGFSFAMWESFYINREVAFYEPVPNLLYANIPVLICVGEDDASMPMVKAKETYTKLKNRGSDKVTFRSIKEEVHQYKKYDVFAIIDTWLSSKFQSTDFQLQKSDSLIIEKHARANELTEEIEALPYEGGSPRKVLSCYHKALETGMTDMKIWFTLGVKLFTKGYNDEAYNSFTKATDSGFPACFASFVWMGHIKDLRNQRKEAISFYKKGLDAYPGFPVQHDHLNIKIDNKWIEERIKMPFKEELYLDGKR